MILVFGLLYCENGSNEFPGLEYDQKANTKKVMQSMNVHLIS